MQECLGRRPGRCEQPAIEIKHTTGPFAVGGLLVCFYEVIYEGFNRLEEKGNGQRQGF